VRWKIKLMADPSVWAIDGSHLLDLAFLGTSPSA